MSRDEANVQKNALDFNLSGHQTATNHGSQTNSSNTIGHYELKKTLGKGNFSTVKLAQHKITDHSVAIKVVKFSDLSEDNLRKITREVDILKKIGRHGHIVRLYQVIKTRRYYFLVTEYCTDGDLYDFIVARGKVSEIQSCNYLLQILSAVEYLHDHNIVHRDLKAENLLLTENFRIVKLADFGFANYFKQDSLLSTYCGSPPYAAPELFKGLHYVGPKVDVWSMGVILYVLVCGSLPFDGQNLVHLKARVLSGKFRIPFFMTSECELLIRNMLRLDPEKRFSIRQIKANGWVRKHESSSICMITCQTETKSRALDNSLSARNTDETRLQSFGRRDDKMAQDRQQQEHQQQQQQQHEQRQHIHSSRGQSLDIDENDKKNESSNFQTSDDASMMCLTSSLDCTDSQSMQANSNAHSAREQKQLATRDRSKCGETSSRMRSFIDNEFTNAVSNMSIDSNNSSISVGYSMDATSNANSNHSACSSCIAVVKKGGKQNGTTSAGSTGGCQTSRINARKFSKDSSIDDQIIDFMVENLKVADNHQSVRHSIAQSKYDDLHAIYRLLRDQPDMVIRENRFKIPSLPLISPSKEGANKKPSITTGFFDSSSDSTTAIARTSVLQSYKTAGNQVFHYKAQGDCLESKHYDLRSEDAKSREECAKQLLAHDDRQKASTKPELVPSLEHTNVVTVAVTAASVLPSAQRQKSSIDQAWISPPQLFLTPPADCKTAARRSVDPSSTATELPPNRMNEPQQETNPYDQMTRHIASRQSFDSTIGNLINPSEMAIPANLADTQVWDSSMLDAQMGTYVTPTTPVMLREGTNTSADSSIERSSVQLNKNLASITTNLPQIGTQRCNQDVVDHSLLLAHLNSPTCAVLMTQSGLLVQNEAQLEQRLQVNAPPVKFTPNNLINQNYTAINPLHQHNLKSNAVPSLNLLDPEGLISGLERRASDGQASYSSLSVTSSAQCYCQQQQNKAGSLIRNHPSSSKTIHANTEDTPNPYREDNCGSQNVTIGSITAAHRDQLSYVMPSAHRKDYQLFNMDSENIVDCCQTLSENSVQAISIDSDNKPLDLSKK